VEKLHCVKKQLFIIIVRQCDMV